MTDNPDWSLSDFHVKSDWEVFEAFLNTTGASPGYPGFFDDVDPVAWAIDYVDELLSSFDWDSLEVPFGRPPRDFRQEAGEASYNLIDQVGDAIAKELAKADPIDEGDGALTPVGHVRGGNRIIRSVALAWLAGDLFHAHSGGAKACTRPPSATWNCPYGTPSAANRARAMAEDDKREFHNTGDVLAAAAEAGGE